MLCGAPGVGGEMRIISAIDRPDVISRILDHLSFPRRARGPTRHRCAPHEPEGQTGCRDGDDHGQQTLEGEGWDAFPGDPPFADDVAPDPDPGWPEDPLPPDED